MNGEVSLKYGLVFSGCSYSVTEANEVASDIVENSTSGVALDNGEEGSEEESSEGEAEDSFKRAERQVDQFADSLSVQNVAGDDDWSSEEDPSVTGNPYDSWRCSGLQDPINLAVSQASLGWHRETMRQMKLTIQSSSVTRKKNQVPS